MELNSMDHETRNAFIHLFLLRTSIPRQYFHISGIFLQAFAIGLLHSVSSCTVCIQSLPNILWLELKRSNAIPFTNPYIFTGFQPVPDITSS